MTQITEKYPYPKIIKKRSKFGFRTAATKEDAKKINEWCRNPQRVKEVIRRFHIWSLNHQWYADDVTREWVEDNIEEIKEKLNIPFFVKLSLNNGEVVELQGSGELTSAMVTPYKDTLVSAEIGELCTSIGNYAFSNCTGLTNITSLAVIAPTIQSDTFQNVKTNGTLRVPIVSTGYDIWMSTSNYYLGNYGWNWK